MFAVDTVTGTISKAVYPFVVLDHKQTGREGMRKVGSCCESMRNTNKINSQQFFLLAFLTRQCV